jgi:hypothetical protein
MNREPIGIGRLPASGCQAIISAIIGVDLPMPEKPTLAAARWWPVWRWHLRCSRMRIFLSKAVLARPVAVGHDRRQLLALCGVDNHTYTLSHSPTPAKP